MYGLRVKRGEGAMGCLLSKTNPTAEALNVVEIDEH